MVSTSCRRWPAPTVASASKRPRIAVPVSGADAAIPLDDRFGLHPGAAALQGLLGEKKLAIVHAAGLTSDTRSHFDAMQFMELGTPDNKSSTTGWLTRHLQTAGNLPSQIIMPALAVRKRICSQARCWAARKASA